MSNDDRRLIEDYLPIQAISAEASREKSVRKGHISTLHLWWARRPLVACRAAVYGALVPASRFRPLNGPEEKRDSLTRANAAKFVERLCKYPGDPNVIAEAERHIEKVEVGGRLLQATGIHERVMELLTEGGIKRVHGTLKPRKLVERLKIGESLAPGEPPRLGIPTSDGLEAFFRDIEPPRLESAAAVRKAIADGVTEGIFGYTSGPIPALGADGKFQVSRDKVAIGRPLAEDEVDFDSGFLMMPSAIADAPTSGIEQPGTAGRLGDETKPTVEEPKPGMQDAQQQRVVRLRFRATRDQVFKAFPAVANLADKSDSGKVTIEVEATAETGFDRTWLRNAVEEPLDEADVEKEEP